MDYKLIKDLERGDKLIKKGQYITLSNRGVKEFIAMGLINDPKAAPKKEKKQDKNTK